MTVELFSSLQATGHEAIVTVYDEASGLKGFIGLHNTTLGPGLGGCRVMRYESEAEALNDVLKLSEAMTYKNALAGLNFGGGKGVIWLQPGQEKSRALVQAMGKRIDMLRGAYFTATDIGSTSADMEAMKEVTPYVSALPPEKGGLGDSAILTGYGVYMGLKAAVKHRHNADTLAGQRIAIQGAGKVAYHLLSHLKHEKKLTVYLADTAKEAVDRCVALMPEIQVVAPEDIWRVEADILSPNAIGGTINEAVLASTRASVVAGGANNPLANRQLANVMKAQDILFAPDFAINSGGVIVLSTELARGTLEEAKAKTEGIYETALRVFAEAEAREINTLEAAISLAKERIEAAASPGKPLGVPEAPDRAPVAAFV